MSRFVPSPPLFLHAIATGDRHESLAAVRDAIERAGGWIEGVHLFSDLMACLNVELPPGTGPALAAGLAAAGVHVPPESEARLQSLGDSPTLVGTLEVTFAGGPGDLRHEVPAVPG